LAGSLSDRYRVGDGVIYAGCSLENGIDFPCDAEFTEEIARELQFPLVKGLTVDRVIATAAGKRDLAARTGYEVVDMEGTIVLQELVGARVTIVRVISDGLGQDLPDLDKAFAKNGDIRAIELAMAMVKRPIASYHLIRGSLRGLRVLERIASIV
jgi:nucleoside phosphorylase